jgi:hypothetical protein
MPLLERLRAFPRKDLHIQSVAKRQHHKVGDFRRHAWQFSHDVAYDREAAGVTVLGPQAIEDSFDGVPLLGRNGFVLFQNRLDDQQERIELGPRRTLPIAGRFFVKEDLFERLSVEGICPIIPASTRWRGSEATRRPCRTQA